VLLKPVKLLEPACSKACPNDSIQFGTIRELTDRAQKRVEQLHQGGEKRTYCLCRRGFAATWFNGEISHLAAGPSQSERDE
jgi:Fe-S-cluster-containing dehydrogenase component